MHELTKFQRDCLYVVAGLDAPNGLDVKAELDNYYESAIYTSRLYYNLEVLVERGLIAGSADGRRTNQYALTDCGRQSLEDRHEWENTQADL